MSHSTITAIATPAGQGGIGIIRISGPEAFSIGSSVFYRAGNQGNNSRLLDNIKTNHFYYGYVRSQGENKIIDEVLVNFMKAPHTYTREDVVEIQGHSGIQTLKSILDIVIQKGAKLAQPGEFTKRAFLNGRIDLTQAEAVIDLINAKSNLSLEIAVSQISGSLKRKISDIRTALLEILSQIEAEIDFPEDVEDIFDRKEMLSRVQHQVIKPIQKLIRNHNNSFLLKKGIKATIVGAPNVGKSSIMNRLSKRDKSIVTPYPGTTRDLIEEHVDFFGAPMVLTDSAGLHSSDDPIEKLGIERALKQIQMSDLVLFVITAGVKPTQNEQGILKLVKDKQIIIVHNKSDLVMDSKALDIPKEFKNASNISVSALKGFGFNRLRTEIEKKIYQKISDFDDPIVPNLRHMKALEDARTSVESVYEGLLNSLPGDLLAVDLGESIRHLSDITGENPTPDILDRIFSEFCIGK
ncbi:MAG: tRNA uridine-5-carboxymethylaminomethyl(34) synthesis GTPase MnmE [Deltaproteobacteria bacterium]|nr:tRNA uridine-5-carboxymethylaminomethyl(34) synthesis GTPase MnmE [Deltaproteobacteria bacterium]